jgi:hypothetical protein
MASVLGICSLLMACEDPQEIGSEVFVQDIGVLYTDTLTVSTSTLLMDSIATNNTDNLLVGRYTDPTFGEVDASAYFHIVNQDTLFSSVDTAGRKDVQWVRFPSKVDSIRFILPYTLYHGDTLQRQTFKVHQLADNALLDASATYYSNSPAPVLKSNLLGQAQNVRIRPVRNKNILSGNGKFDTLRIPITDPAFISFIASQRDAKVKDDVLIGTGFRNRIRGLALTSESNKNAAVLGFSADFSVVRIYYNYRYTYMLRNKANTADSIRTTVDTTKFNELYIGFYNRGANGVRGTPVNARFNKLTSSRTGDYSKLINAGNILPSASTKNEVALQSSTGLGVKVNFPTLLKLKERKDIAINKGELVLEPNNSNASLALPQDLVLIEMNNTNRPLRTTTTGDGNLLYIGGENYNAAYTSKTNDYTFNVTSALQNILSGRNKTNGWVLAPNVFATNANGQRVLVSGKNIVGTNVDRAVFKSSNIKLKIYYTYVSK